MGHRLTAHGGMELIEVALRHPQVKLVVSALGVAPREMIDVLHARGIKVGALVGSVEHAAAPEGCRHGYPRGPGHGGRRPYRKHRVDGAVAAGRRCRGAPSGSRRRWRRTRAADRGGANPRRRGRVVRIDLARHTRKRAVAGDEGALLRGRIGGRRAKARADGEAVPHAAQRLHRSLDAARCADAAADAAAVHAGRRGARAHRARRPSRLPHLSMSARSSATCARRLPSGRSSRTCSSSSPTRGSASTVSSGARHDGPIHRCPRRHPRRRLHQHDRGALLLAAARRLWR